MSYSNSCVVKNPNRGKTEFNGTECGDIRWIKKKGAELQPLRHYVTSGTTEELQPCNCTQRTMRTTVFASLLLFRQTEAWGPRKPNLKRFRTQGTLRQQSTSDSASVCFLVSGDGKGSVSSFGATSPEPNPKLADVAGHLATRMNFFDGRLSGAVVTEEDLVSGMSGTKSVLEAADVILCLGCSDPRLSTALVQHGAAAVAVLTDGCDPSIRALEVLVTRRGASTQA